MPRVLFWIVFFLFSCSYAYSQEIGRLYCGQVEERERRMAEHPENEPYSREATEYLENYTLNYSEDREGDGDIYLIPVVFHVIHNNGAENISDEQILDGLQILNRDFRKLNSDISQVVNEFAGLTADVGIEFRLATLDPQGNCTRGINRVQSALTNDGNEEMKTLIYWPRNKYLNVWICANASGAAGYTNMPGDVNNSWDASSDGIVIRADYVGSIGTSSVTKSRTLTHEVGHWLNLYHCWGPNNTPELQENCNQDDMVSDTPNTIGYYSCSLGGNSCGSALDNVQNYMEYSYCSKMFTLGQRARMRAAITSPVAQRNQLTTLTNLAITGASNPELCFADFSVDITSGCVGTSVHFTDHSYHEVTDWTWNFGDNVIISGNDPGAYRNPEHIYTAPGIYTVTLTVSNASGSLTKSYNNLVTIIDAGEADAPYSEGFESIWPASKWFVFNSDGNYTWEVTPAAFYSGSKGLKLRNFNNTIIDNSDALVSTTFDMAAKDTIYLSYKWAYASKLTATDDRLRVSVSSDCGETWVLKRNRRGLTNLPTALASNAAFTPVGTDQWSGETVTINEASMMTEYFRVKFEFIGKGGNNIFLDDINITAVENPAGIASQLSGDFFFNIYPNPSQGDVIAEVRTTESEHLRMSLFNSIGQQCDLIFDSEIHPGKSRFEIPSRAAGVYMLLIEKEGGSFTKRIIFE